MRWLWWRHGDGTRCGNPPRAWSWEAGEEASEEIPNSSDEHTFRLEKIRDIVLLCKNFSLVQIGCSIKSACLAVRLESELKMGVRIILDTGKCQTMIKQRCSCSLKVSIVSRTDPKWLRPKVLPKLITTRQIRIILKAFKWVLRQVELNYDFDILPVNSYRSWVRGSARDWRSTSDTVTAASSWTSELVDTECWHIFIGLHQLFIDSLDWSSRSIQAWIASFNGLNWVWRAHRVVII